MKKSNSPLKDISWDDIQKYIDKDAYQNFFKQINPSIFKIALNDKDRPRVIEAILKVLKEKDPKNVSLDYAEKVADRMKELARMILKGK
jgi:hypothetical protein